MLRVLIDADMFAFRACSSCERDIDWGNNIWTLHVDIEEARNKFIDITEDAISRGLNKMKYVGMYDTICCFSSYKNFRKKVLPTYKANREGRRKPVAYASLVRWIEKEFNTKEIIGLEADDCIGILATKDDVPSLIISGDKDMKCIPGYHYDFLRNEFCKVSPEEAQYHFFKQTLMGDITDGYSGCPKVGAKTAEKILEEDCSWDAVVKAFEKQGLSEKVALQQARVAKILLASDYDIMNKKVILWKP